VGNVKQVQSPRAKQSKNVNIDFQKIKGLLEFFSIYYSNFVSNSRQLSETGEGKGDFCWHFKSLLLVLLPISKSSSNINSCRVVSNFCDYCYCFQAMAMSKRGNNHNTLRFSYPKQTESSQDEILSKEILEGRWKSQSVDYLEEDPLSLNTPTITTSDSPVKKEVENLLITFPSQDEIDINLEVKVEQTERPEDYCDTITEEVDAEESPNDMAVSPVEVNLNLSESNEHIEAPKKSETIIKCI